MINISISRIEFKSHFYGFGMNCYKCTLDSGMIIWILTKRDVRNKESLKSVIQVLGNIFVEKNN